jgi:hypothetical protein
MEFPNLSLRVILYIIIGILRKSIRIPAHQASFQEER